MNHKTETVVKKEGEVIKRRPAATVKRHSGTCGVRKDACTRQW